MGDVIQNSKSFLVMALPLYKVIVNLKKTTTKISISIRYGTCPKNNIITSMELEFLLNLQSGIILTMISPKPMSTSNSES